MTGISRKSDVSYTRERIFLLLFLMLISSKDSWLFHFRASWLWHSTCFSHSCWPHTGIGLFRDLRRPEFFSKSWLGIKESPQNLVNFRDPGNSALGSSPRYPQIIWVHLNGGREDVAMTFFFIKTLQVRSSLMVTMMIQVLEGIPEKLGVLWVPVNLPLTISPLISWNEKRSGDQCTGSGWGIFNPRNPTVTQHLKLCFGHFFHVNDFVDSGFETRKSTWKQREIQMENSDRNENSHASKLNIIFNCPVCKDKCPLYLGHINVLYMHILATVWIFPLITEPMGYSSMFPSYR